MYALDALLERLPAALVDDPAAKRLRLLGDRLPDALSRRVGLEARLDDDPRVDLLLLAADTRELDILAGVDPSIRLPGPLAATPAWRAAARLARRARWLAVDGAPLPPGVWLELDTDTAAPAPALFTAAGPDPDHEAVAGWDAAGTVAAVLAAAGDAEPPADLVAALARVAAGPLPVRQVGVFASRPHAGVRLFCCRPPGTPLAPALAAAGWEGDAAAVTAWTAVAEEYGDTLHVGLDVTPIGPLPTVGLEIAVAGAAQPPADPRWGRLLALLVDRGLATPAKAAAVQQLGRAYELRLPHRRRYRQGLHHLKITVGAGGSAAAKVYFGAYEEVAG
ncbi:hypothetical protein GCM10010123_39030 [Pilimelia anulata]|uniref:Uncharacterized protein n=1 Tax=Pilimelia anulata TaxID=53371 RepID=A0A8J3FCD0_9ACTN|nr:hypothetical protein [Pilimelia anulata]GGK05363.1 hypothetical protein GCM10010123_39030 [Pilimelia anulata]